jgi:ketosteroid isomerase-like protein
LLRRGYAAFVRGNMDEAMDLLDPQFVLEVHTGRADLPEAPVYHGRAGFLENWRNVTEPFDDVALDPEEISGTPERMIVSVRMAGRGKASGAPFEVHLAHVWALSNGRAHRLDIYPNMKAALAAAQGAESHQQG